MDPDTRVARLANGARVVTIRLPHLQSVSISVFVRTGSRHESPRENGISHFVEHMAFKGTLERDCQRVNLDAERLGGEVNAHTDKDHTAYHVRGLAEHAEEFLGMLGDIVRNSTFPETELERERQVILHEFVEDEDDPLATAYKLFDRACFGDHPIAQPVIGNRRNILRFTREQLLDYVHRQYTGANLIVGVAGNVDPDAIERAADAAFGALPAGAENAVAPPAYLGGVKARRLGGCPQTHVVLGFPIPALAGDHAPSVVAAALFGEGMSSPLMDQIRERRGLVYYAACSADVDDLVGQFVIEASTGPGQLDEFVAEVMRLLAAHTRTIGAVDLERARNQIVVRSLRAFERPFRRLEDAAHELHALGRVRSRAEQLERIGAVGARDVRDAFARMLEAPASVAIAGRVARDALDRLASHVGAPSR